MIQYKKGNLFEIDAEALVNTVNCVGVMGKGIALQFKQAFPNNFTEYQKECRAQNIKPGKMFTVPTGKIINPKYIINFPTKRHWKEKSKLSDIEAGLKDLINEIKRLNIKSIAVPPLGCGNGGLQWNDVRIQIEKAFISLPDVHVYLFSPAGSPEPDEIKTDTKKPRLTRARALFIALMNNYTDPGYRLSLLEIQKLGYFLQEAGEQLRLRFVKHIYGPYADNLNHVLQHLDGHYIRGYGDRSKEAQIHLLPNAAKEAFELLSGEHESLKRLEKVSNTIKGFETPYGLELLSTVHWVIKENSSINSQPDKIVKAVHGWSGRKQKIFKKEHIYIAWQHLNNSGAIHNNLRKEQ
ncbi:MAG: type II toxin-antitoxin system antitoxin DNA ADP-ribosyl glycohydrolase DarG [Bacillota bacterium]